MKRILFLVVVIAVYTPIESSARSFLRRPAVKATAAMVVGAVAGAVDDKIMPKNELDQFVWIYFRTILLGSITESLSARDAEMGSLSNAFCWGLYGKKSVTNLRSNKIFAGMNGAAALYYAKNMVYPSPVSAQRAVTPSATKLVGTKA